MSSPSSHALPISYVTRNGMGPKDVQGATASLLWVDRPFAVTTAKLLSSFRDRLSDDSTGHVQLGGLALDDLPSRILCLDDRLNLATVDVKPEELPRLGPEASFYSPLHWPPRPVTPGEKLHVLGFPRDQWPAQLRFVFRVEEVDGTRFGATLDRVDMPGCLDGLCGAPMFRPGPQPELVGVVVESLFCNELVRAEHAQHVDTCGRFAGPDDTV